jgi:hypothetical protein
MTCMLYPAILREDLVRGDSPESKVAHSPIPSPETTRVPHACSDGDGNSRGKVQNIMTDSWW